jgi:hypothetical protein
MGNRATTVGDYVTGSLDCPNGWAGAKLLSCLADEDAATPGARDAALALRRDYPEDAAFVAEVFRRARALRFDREAGEVFAMGSYTWDAGGGDCDDHARAVVALLRAGGIPARIAYLHPRGGDPTHAVAQAWTGGAWRWLESTLPARMDEHPIAAARRLGHLRSDLSMDASYLDPITLDRKIMQLPADQAATLGALTADQVAHFEQKANTGDLSPAFFRAVAMLARRMRLRGADVTGEDLLAVMNGESGVRATKKGQNWDHTWDYGLNMLHDVAGLRWVGWTGTPEAYLALPPETQIDYVGRYFDRVIPANAWPMVHGARSLYAVNAWPGYFASRPAAFLVDDYVIASKGKGVYYPPFDFGMDGTNRPRDIDRWISLQQANAGARWIEVRARYWIEAGDLDTRDLSFWGAAKTGAFVGACGVVAIMLAKDT